ncbi:TPA: TraI/MobA(P) family conjugative relaxase [Vibrio parahaemolyticus]|uniref:TraI/MobA(P) family conjugative relaxase n=1 Tax=Vibrio diabolicus TaxID=50719 RepID=UPI00249510B7|nr:TraI/MobA(P) family conjugative relaxase [Vibrio diabolicus]
MIAKHVPMRSSKKSDFSGLVKYITDEQSKTERLGLVNVTNCQAQTMSAVISEVLATQHQNTRAEGDKTYHLIVGFPPGETPSEDVLKDIEKRICEGLGFGEHQRVSAVHHDTDHMHMHIAINKIHPNKKTIHEPYKAYKTLSGLCEILEKEHGLQRVNHKSARTLSEGRANDMEQHAGIESLVSWVRRECLEEIRAAENWQQLHQVLSENSLEIRQQGNGLVIESTDGTQVKASTLARDLSKPKLEKKLGEFEAINGPLGSQEKRRRYKKRPTRFKVNTTELYARYQEEQKQLTAAKKIEWINAKGRKDSRIEAAKRKNRLRRAAIKLMGEGRLNKKILYSQAHKALKADIQAINQAAKLERQGLHEKYKRRAWADWLKQEALKGNKTALEALRARDKAKALKGDVISGERVKAASVNVEGLNKPNVAPIGKKPPAFVKNRPRSMSSVGAVKFEHKPGHAPVMDNITKKGTIIYRAGKSAIRDDGDKLQISREATNEALKDALLLAKERYGNRITVNGSAQFKAQVIFTAATLNLPITFADAGMERRRQTLLNQENNHDRREQTERRSGDERGRSDRPSTSRIGRGITEHTDSGRGPATRSDERGSGNTVTSGTVSTASSSNTVDRTDTGNDRRNVLNKPNVTGIGRNPPSIAKNRLRTLSSLSVVRFARRSEMLLSSDVPVQLDNQGPKPDNQLRWGVPGPGRLTPSEAAVNKYLSERESKRAKGFDIPKHSRYNNQPGAVTYGGTRNVEGQALALLNRGDEVLVLPIDKATAQRMKRVRIGEAVTVTPKGSLKKSKGRGR